MKIFEITILREKRAQSSQNIEKLTNVRMCQSDYTDRITWLKWKDDT